MRILHTSDWHIGRTFHGVDLLADQAAALTAIAELVAEHGADVVVVPGDIYDRSIPSADAVAVCNAGLEAIRAAGAVIIATSGNHDSPVRLGAGAAFAAHGGLHLITRVSQVARPLVLNDEHGPVAFYGIPYLEPEITRAELDVPGARSHQEILDAAMARVQTDAAERSGRAVVLAHAFVVGGEPTESERSISVGGVETVSAATFDGADYVALGTCIRRRRCPNTSGIRGRCCRTRSASGRTARRCGSSTSTSPGSRPSIASTFRWCEN